MTTEEFRESLGRMKLSQGALARMFKALGDTADPLTIRRRVESWAQGRTRVPGEAAAFMTLLERFPAVREALCVPAAGAEPARP